MILIGIKETSEKHTGAHDLNKNMSGIQILSVNLQII